MKRIQRDRIKIEKTLRGQHGPDRAMADLDLAVKKYGGSLRESFLTSGYKSVDEFIYESRGRDAFKELKPVDPTNEVK